MKDRRPDEKVIQSFVVHKGKSFLVSTIERNSSAAAAPDLRFNETIVWEWHDKTGKGVMLYTEDDRQGSIRVHQAIVESLHRTGLPPQGGAE